MNITDANFDPEPGRTSRLPIPEKTVEKRGRRDEFVRGLSYIVILSLSLQRYALLGPGITRAYRSAFILTDRKIRWPALR